MVTLTMSMGILARSSGGRINLRCPECYTDMRRSSMGLSRRAPVVPLNINRTMMYRIKSNSTRCMAAEKSKQETTGEEEAEDSAAVAAAGEAVEPEKRDGENSEKKSDSELRAEEIGRQIGEMRAASSRDGNDEEKLVEVCCRERQWHPGVVMMRSHLNGSLPPRFALPCLFSSSLLFVSFSLSALSACLHVYVYKCTHVYTQLSVS